MSKLTSKAPCDIRGLSYPQGRAVGGSKQGIDVLTCSLSKAGPGRSGGLLQGKGPTMEEGQQRKKAAGRDGGGGGGGLKRVGIVQESVKKDR